MPEAPFRARLAREFAARRAGNPRYSLRAFAACLGTNHSTLSQILRGLRGVPLNRVRGWAKKLGMGSEEAGVYFAAEQTPDSPWTAEAFCLLHEPAHWAIVRLCREPGFQADCRWIAARAGLTVDSVNMALSRLLRLGLLETGAGGEWKEMTGLGEAEFRSAALRRAREKT